MLILRSYIHVQLPNSLPKTRVLTFSLRETSHMSEPASVAVLNYMIILPHRERNCCVYFASPSYIIFSDLQSLLFHFLSTDLLGIRNALSMVQCGRVLFIISLRFMPHIRFYGSWRSNVETFPLMLPFHYIQIRHLEQRFTYLRKVFTNMSL